MSGNVTNSGVGPSKSRGSQDRPLQGTSGEGFKKPMSYEEAIMSKVLKLPPCGLKGCPEYVKHLTPSMIRRANGHTILFCSDNCLKKSFR